MYQVLRAALKRMTRCSCPYWTPTRAPTPGCLLSTCKSEKLRDVCRYSLDGVPASAKHISMIAGGTGITPMYQVIKAVLKNPDDDTQLSLLYANQSPDDILLFEELLEMAKDSRLKVWYTGMTLLSVHTQHADHIEI